MLWCIWCERKKKQIVILIDYGLFKHMIQMYGIEYDRIKVRTRNAILRFDGLHIKAA